MRRRSFAFGVAATAAAVAVPASAQQRLKVVASFSILGDMVREIGGDRVELTTLVGPDQDAHTYQPTPSDARALAAARVLVVNGLGFEGWIDRLARAAPFAGTRVVASAGVATIAGAAAGHGHGHGHAHGGGEESLSTRKTQAAPKAAPDPHCWQDVANGARYARNIAQALVAADAANAAHYRQRADAYDRRLTELDAWVRAQIGTVPAAKRKVITGHDAFGYFARAYGVAFRAPVGISTENEPSARDVAALIRQIRSEGIKALFIENMSNPKLVEQIARDAGGVVGPALHVDALSKPGGPADTYERMFRHNVPALVAGMLRN
ncbi:MAG: zinc ABC transporter substrate-binding protein [Rhodospirillales bacterium]|nr:MAG: zinc ABC transporter substrate-binding protein [Rhodospirillales bacterium]